MSDNKNKNPVIGLAFLIAATAGGYMGGNALKPYYDTAVDYVKTDVLEQETTATPTTQKISAEAQVLKDQCNEVGNALGNILLASGVDASFTHTYSTPTVDSGLTHGTCSMQIKVPGRDEPFALADFYNKSDLPSNYSKAKMIATLMQNLPKDADKIAAAAPQIFNAFPKAPNP